MTDGTKRCTKCGETKSLDQFPIRIDRGSKPRSHCKPCHNAAQKTPRSKALQKAWRYQAKYGMTVGQVHALLVEQGHKCPLCLAPLTEATLHVDHDHTSGHVRGLLCHMCNVGIGLLKDDPAVLARAASYLSVVA